MAITTNIQHLGGQHRTPQGISTFDDETDAERRERRRRAHAELDAIEAAVNEAIEAGEFDVAF